MVSAIPIAIVSNAARVTVAAVLQDLIGVRAKDVFHDYAGWIMMILAMLLLWGEMVVDIQVVVGAAFGVALDHGRSSGRRGKEAWLRWRREVARVPRCGAGRLDLGSVRARRRVRDRVPFLSPKTFFSVSAVL